ncbi:DUF4625 domain-containing protein [Algoriphagus litoralis]|uniref:DUF4625 domain-containing protein n=1 Tax=Algoriphagus litoralis TaxID=2202829 RepID=UPI000DB9A5EC|nr:DUF4625 domain-containing protein [Algoriphagus litoralis]
MKNNLSFLLAILSGLLLTSCGDSENPKDLDPPVISSLTAGQEIQPSPGMLVTPSNQSVNVDFRVSDPSGVKEILLDIHGGFDGHSHARLTNSFERLNVKRIFSSTASNPNLVIPSGAQDVSIDSHEIAWEGTNSEVVGNLLAGPYHITISATDSEGNQTGFADGSNYHTTFYIQRPYAPAISLAKKPNGKLEASVGQNLILAGQVKVTDHSLSSPLKFIWMRLTNEVSLDEQKDIAESTFAEVMLGTSSWRSLSGDPLESAHTLDLAAFIAQHPLQVPAGQQNLSLVIWAEDTAGNVTRESIPLEIK